MRKIITEKHEICIDIIIVKLLILYQVNSQLNHVSFMRL